MSQPLVLACLLVVSASALAQAGAAVTQDQGPFRARAVIEPELQQAMLAALPGARLPAYLVMTSQLTPQDLEPSTRGLHGREQRHAVAAALQAHANSTQGAARAALQEAVAADRASDVHFLWMGNAIVFTAEAAVI
ncbi:MAG TPA: hypothetical protein VES36_00035, partial [Candidatus Limnocylindrales bacterium]|nr:hypothetical protein [Candidatus Limnocylindrales bacterium]